MDLLEVAVLVFFWLLIAFLGWRKRAARRSESAPSPVPEEASGRGIVDELRDLVRQFREGWVPPEETAEVPPAVEDFVSGSIPPPPETAVLPLPDELPDLLPATVRRRRRPGLAQTLLRDLGSGRRSLARAVLLREILGPPVALQRGRDQDLPAGSSK